LTNNLLFIASVLGAVVQWTSPRPPQAQETPSPEVQQLINELRALSPDATRESFLGRRAMADLITLGPKAYSALKSTFLTSDDWATRISTGYLVLAMDQGTDDATRVRITELMRDDHPYVRSVAAAICATVPIRYAKEEAEKLLQVGGHSVASMQGWSPSIDWLPDSHVPKLVENAIVAIDQGQPLLDPPQWWSVGGGRSSTGNPESVSGSGMRVLTRSQAIAELAIKRLLLSGRSHGGIQPVLESLVRDDAADQARLGRKILLTEIALGHTGPCQNVECEMREKIAAQLVAACEKWAWSLSEPGALRAVVSALGALTTWSDRATQLLEELNLRHPNPSVRKLAELRLTEHTQRLADGETLREKKRAHEVEVRKIREARRAVQPSIPEHEVPIHTKAPPAGDLSENGFSIGRWIVVGAVGLVVLITAWVYAKTRTRLDSKL
jgi:hypothetical protein